MALTKVHTRMINDTIFNVVDFGADPTGVANSRTPINDAFAACEAAGSGTVFFPNGTYYCSDFVGSSLSTNLTDIKIVGEGATISVNPTTSANYSLYLYWPNLNSILVDGLTIDGNTKTASGIAIRNQSATATCQNAVVQNCTIKNIHGVNNAAVTVNPIGIYIDSTFEGNKAQITNCTVDNVTRDKTGLACTGVAITGFRVVDITHNFIRNIRHSGVSGDIIDADGIKVFAKYHTVGADTVYYDINALIQNNAVYDCEGRFVKTQANGQVKIDNNSFRIDNRLSNLELINNFRGVDCQVGEGLVTNNDFYFGSGFTGGGSACAIMPQSPAESTTDFRSFTHTISGNKIEVVQKIPYVILPTAPADSSTYSFKLYLNILDNIVNIADADSTFTTTNQSTQRPSNFMYVNNYSWPTAANLNGEMHWKINGNVVDTYEFLNITTGSEDYTGKWFLHIHNNVKYPTGFSRVLLAGSTSYTSNISLSNNHIGGGGTGTVAFDFDFTKLIAPCDFYIGAATCTNAPAAYQYRNAQYCGGVWKVIDSTGMYLSSDCTTWTRVS